MELKWLLVRIVALILIWVTLTMMGNPTFKSFALAFVIVGGCIILQILYYIIKGHIKDYMNKMNKTGE